MMAITCINCGSEGVMNVSGPHDNSPKRFKRIGRNHVSGHLHYQCPVCKMVLLVEPRLIHENSQIPKKDATNSALLAPRLPYSLLGASIRCDQIKNQQQRI